jgi:hypothetical protein
LTAADEARIGELVKKAVSGRRSSTTDDRGARRGVAVVTDRDFLIVSLVHLKEILGRLPGTVVRTVLGP